MYNIGGIAFDEYYVRSVELELENCDLTIKVVFHKENITIYNVNISKWYSLFPLKYYNKFYGKCCLVPNQNGGLL